ncbi:ead/Ea22-like family protein [Cronobacter turicensis]
MTDTAKLKAAALAATPGPWVETRGEVTTADYEVDGGIYLDHVCNCEIIGTESPNAEFIALANPAAVLELIAALEAARADCRENAARIAELESQRALAFSACNRWADKCREAEKRVAELRARKITVRFDAIPMSDLGNGSDGKAHPYLFGAGYNSATVRCKSELQLACAVAGINLETGGE